MLGSAHALTEAARPNCGSSASSSQIKFHIALRISLLGLTDAHVYTRSLPHLQEAKSKKRNALAQVRVSTAIPGIPQAIRIKTDRTRAQKVSGKFKRINMLSSTIKLLLEGFQADCLVRIVARSLLPLRSITYRLRRI
ncbi:MAG TPA: hypothetical protein VFG03_22260 [Telluria sp.]|nr:hypothetical protein [Telluria sp.]